MRIVRTAMLVTVLALVLGSGAAALDLLAARLPDALVGSPYSFQLEGDEGCPPSYRFSFSSGRLPAGIQITTKGLITGTPTEAGTFDFYANLADDCGSAMSQMSYTLIVAPQLVVTTASLQPATVGIPYSVRLAAAGGGTQAWAVRDGTLPGGLTLSGDGLLSGTPTSPGTSTFTVAVSDAARSGTKQLILVVAAPLALTPPAARPAEVGVRFSTAAGLSGGAPPFAWSVASGALPAGLTLDGSTGTIGGVPTAAGVYSLTLSVTSGDGATATLDLKLAVARRLTIVTRHLASGRVGRAYMARLVAGGGVRPLTWSLAGGALPAGIRLAERTGRLSGRAFTAGTARVVLRVSDPAGGVATRALVLVVKPS